MKARMLTKRFFLVLQLALLLFILPHLHTNIQAQPASNISNAPNLSCGMDNSYSGYSYPFFPMQNDTLRALVVFCNFPSPSGNYDISGSSLLQYWPGTSAQTMPTWADSIICPSTTNIWDRNLTGLFKDASLGKFFLIGDVYPHLYVFQNPVSYYASTSLKIGAAVKELLQNIDDSVNFAAYDKFDPFDYNSNSNRREPDGIVDFIFINFRFNNSSTIDAPSYTGIADLGGRARKFGDTLTRIVLDGKVILAGFPGSGCLYEMNTPWDIGIPAHEFGQHYSFGSVHNNIMGAYNMSGGGLVSAADRVYLGWNNSSAMTSSSNISFTLRDFFTTGDYVKIRRTTDTIYLENRGRNSYYSSTDFRRWKWLSTDPKYPFMRDSSLLIYRQMGLNVFDIQSANGRWNWAKCPTNNKYKVQFNSSTFNFFQHYSLNRFSGETTFDLYEKPSLNLDCEQITFLGSNTNVVTYMGVNGDSNTCFDIDYNQVYSPWSNPPLPIYNSNDSITIELTGRNSNGSINVDVYYTNILGASPSKPQRLEVEKFSTGSGFRPKLSWNKNLEPDLVSYNIYRVYLPAGFGQTTDYDSIANTSDTTFIDWSAVLYGVASGQCSVVTKYAYKISSIDNTNKESVRSEEASISGYTGMCLEEDNVMVQTNISYSDKIQRIDGIENITAYKLYDNFPNPFNPSTQVRFDLPIESFVKLKIYDVMAREIQTLVNENKRKGSYLVSFNAVNNASGIYYYKLQANNFIIIKKMILLK